MVACGHLNIVQYLCEICELDPLAEDSLNYTSIHYASLFGKIEVLINDRKCDPNLSKTL